MIIEKRNILDLNVLFVVGLNIFTEFKKEYWHGRKKSLRKLGGQMYHSHRRMVMLYIKMAEISNYFFYLHEELVKNSSRILHPAKRKLPNLSRLANETEIHTETVKIRSWILRACKHCRRYKPALTRFEASIASVENLVFGDKRSVNGLFLDRRDVLQVVETATTFSAASY